MLSRHRRSKAIVVSETPSEVVSSGGSGNRKCCTSSSSASSDPSTSSHVGKSERHSILQELRTSKEYLLQTCLKYDWRTVERICLVLITYFERRQQQRRRQHYETSRAQLTALDPWGNTPLHAACYFRPTQNVIKLLLQAARLYDVPLSTSINEKGATPLVIACSAGSSTHIIQQLLEASASSSSNGGVATMVSCVDYDSTTPFVALARRYQMLRRIPRYSKVTLPLEQITKETMGMEEERDAYNNNSISSSDGSFLDSSTRSNSSSSSSSSDTTVTTTTLPPHNGYGYFDNDNDEENDLQTGFDSQKLFHTLWKKMNAIIQATWFADHINNNSNSNNKNTTIRKSLPLRQEFHSILHGAAYVSDLLPPVMSSLLIRCHEELVSLNNDKNTTTTTTTNNNGILPLHLAVTVDSASSCCYNNPTLLEQRTFFIEQLLKVDPTTALCPIPTNGRLPLMEAIASGLPWHFLVLDDSATTTRTPSNKTLRTTTCHEEQEDSTTSTCTISDTDDSSDEDDDEEETESSPSDGSCESNVPRKQQKQPPPQKGPLQLLWDAAPDAMNHKDPVTGLRPFMFAAASAVPTQNTTKDDNGSTTGGGGAEELQQLDTIFALLKLDPSSVQCD